LFFLVILVYADGIGPYNSLGNSASKACKGLSQIPPYIDIFSITPQVAIVLFAPCI
jgi:hypothetical protein